MKTRLALLVAAGLTTLNALAAGTANTSATGLIDDVKATYDVVLPIGLGIAGTFLAVAMARKAWRRFAK